MSESFAEYFANRDDQYLFEQSDIPMKLIGAGFRYRVDRGRGVVTVLSGKRAGLHFEFLQHIRERQGKVQIVVRVVVSCAVQAKRQTIRQPARD